eukprot:8477989-Pyramimonas_sp.AAC.1
MGSSTEGSSGCVHMRPAPPAPVAVATCVLRHPVRRFVFLQEALPKAPVVVPTLSSTALRGFIGSSTEGPSCSDRMRLAPP